MWGTDRAGSRAWRWFREDRVMNRVVHFEIPADDPARAVRFYSAAFGWQIQDVADGGYYLITTGADDEVGINGGLYKRDAPLGAGGENAFVNVIQVGDLDESIRRIKQHGGTVLA